MAVLIQSFLSVYWRPLLDLKIHFDTRRGIRIRMRRGHLADSDSAKQDMRPRLHSAYVLEVRAVEFAFDQT